MTQLTPDKFLDLLLDLRDGKRPVLNPKEIYLTNEQCEVALSFVDYSTEKDYHNSLSSLAGYIAYFDIAGYRNLIDLRYKALALAKDMGGDPTDWPNFTKKAKHILKFVLVAPVDILTLRHLKDTDF